MEQLEILLLKKERDDAIIAAYDEEFVDWAVDTLYSCLVTNGDVVDTMNTIDLRYSDMESVSDKMMCEIVIKAAKKIRDQQL